MEDLSIPVTPLKSNYSPRKTRSSLKNSLSQVEPLRYSKENNENFSDRLDEADNTDLVKAPPSAKKTKKTPKPIQLGKSEVSSSAAKNDAEPEFPVYSLEEKEDSTRKTAFETPKVLSKRRRNGKSEEKPAAKKEKTEIDFDDLKSSSTPSKILEDRVVSSKGEETREYRVIWTSNFQGDDDIEVWTPREHIPKPLLVSHLRDSDKKKKEMKKLKSSKESQEVDLDLEELLKEEVPVTPLRKLKAKKTESVKKVEKVEEEPTKPVLKEVKTDNDSKIAQICEMGYTLEEATFAIEAYVGEIDDAVNFLIGEDPKMLAKALKQTKKKDSKTTPKKKRTTKEKAKKEETPKGKKRKSKDESSETPKKKSKKGEKEEEESSNNKRSFSSKRWRSKTWADMAKFARTKEDVVLPEAEAEDGSASDTTEGKSKKRKPSSFDEDGNPIFSVAFSLKPKEEQPVKTRKKSRVQNKKKAPAKIDSLELLCMKVIVKFIDCVETFGLLPETVQNKLCAMLAKTGKMNKETLQLFLDPDVQDLALTNCAALDVKSLMLIPNSCKLLRTLGINAAGRLSDEVLNLISANCPLIEKISLDGSYMLTDASLCNFVETHPKLQSLTICWSYRFTEKFMISLGNNCKDLKELTLKQCTQLNDMAVHIEKLKNLETLALDHAAITDEGFSAILSGISKSLRVLSLKDCSKLTNESFLLIAQCKDLTGLSFLRLEVSDEVILAIAESCKRMNQIAISECKQITAEILPSLVANLLDLSRVEFTHFALSPEQVGELLQNVKQLTHLNLSWCRDMNDECVDQLLETCKKLKETTLWGCTKVTDVGVGKLLQKNIKVIGKDQFFREDIVQASF